MLYLSMSAENNPSKNLEEERLRYAKRMLNANLVGWVGNDAYLSGNNLPDYIEWNKNSSLGQGIKYIGNKRVGCYFVSQEEFIQACKDNGEPIDEIAVFEGHQILPPKVRDFDEKVDAAEFTFDPKKYSVIKIYKNVSIALAGKTDENGIFSIDVYPGKTLKINILQACIEHMKERVDKRQIEIDGFQKIIDKHNDHLREINSLGQNS